MNREDDSYRVFQREVERYPILSPWPHFYEYSRRECFIGIPAMILRDISDFYRVKCYQLCIQSD